MPPKILLSVCGAGGGAGGAGCFSVSGGVEDVFDVMYGLEVDSSLSGEVAGRVSSPTNSMDGILWGAGRGTAGARKNVLMVDKRGPFRLSDFSI